MSDYFHTGGMTTIACYKCGINFGMPDSFHRSCKKKGPGKTFYCPNGHGQVYRSSEADKLREQLERAQGRLSQANSRAVRAEEDSRRKQRKYARIRDRVKNGVCPCCNRTFQNLQHHMKSQHPDFGKDKQLKTLRLLYGLTQTDLADEIGVSAGSISLVERGMGVGEWVQNRVDSWLETA